MWSLVILLILSLCIIFFLKEKPLPVGLEKNIYYLNKDWPAMQSPVQIDAQAGPYFYSGLGNCADGKLSFFADERVEATLKIDLRTVDFNNLEWPKKVILQVYEDPWIFIDALESKYIQTVKVSWRGKTESYSAQTSIKKIPPNSLGKNNPPVENIAYSLEFDLDLSNHGFRNDWHFREFIKEKTSFLHGRQEVSREMWLKQLLPDKIHLRIHATFSPVYNPIPDREHNVIAGKNIEILGNPFKGKYRDGSNSYARNVWDMQVFNGRIYLGHGNSNNMGPAPNAGPVDIWYWDIDDNRFVKEFVVDDEQIDHFRIIDGQLITPGHDPKEAWDLGNFYILEEGQWKKIRTIPDAIHNYDMLKFREQLFAALGTTNGAAIAMSDDNGKTWNIFDLPKRRAFTLFPLNNKLYTSTFGNAVFEYNKEGFHQVLVNLFPDVTAVKNMLVVRPVRFKDTLVYIGANNSIDHQWMPFGLFKATSIERSNNIQLPEGDAPYDIVVNGSYCYVLINSAPEPADGKYKNWVKVLRSEDLVTWQEIVRFEANTFARSFEISEEDIYFGMGSSAAQISPETGNILRISGVLQN